MTGMFPTRAEQLHIKPKVLAARTRKALEHHRQRLTTLALPYADIDNSVEGALDDLLAAFDDFAARINDTVEWLNETADS